MANPFYVEPANPLQALLSFDQSYEGAQKKRKQSELEAAYKDVGQQVGTGGLNPSAIGRLIGLGPSAAPLLSAAVNLNKGSQTDDITEYNFAKGQGFQGTLADWIQRKRAGAGEYSLNPTWGEDAQGNVAVTQLGKGGEAVPTKFPPGFKPSRGVEKVDLGDSWGFMNKQTGEILRTAPKNIQEKEAAEERGKAQGQAQVSLPNAIFKGQYALETIDKLEKHPGLKYAVGWAGVVPPIAGMSQRGAIALINQLKGQVFLEAFESLKGGGAITEAEGAKAEQARARLDRGQSAEDFNAALSDLKSVINRGIEMARRRASGAQPTGSMLGGGETIIGGGPAEPAVDWKNYFGTK